MATHYVYEIEDLGEFYVAKIPICNGVSIHERVHFFGSHSECNKIVRKLKKASRKRR